MSDENGNTEKLQYALEDIIQLNVGGQRFDTALRTLLAERSSDIFNHFVILMETDLKKEKLPPRDPQGAFFLDRDPEHFRTLLNNLRYVVHLQDRHQSNASDDDTKSTKSHNLWSRIRGK